MTPKPTKLWGKAAVGAIGKAGRERCSYVSCGDIATGFADRSYSQILHWSFG